MEDYLYRIYFKDDELEQVKEAQERDCFEDLVDMKNDAVEEVTKINTIKTRFTISYVVPTLKDNLIKRPVIRRKTVKLASLGGEHNDSVESEVSIKETAKPSKVFSSTKTAQQFKLHEEEAVFVEKEIKNIIDKRMSSPEHSVDRSKSRVETRKKLIKRKSSNKK